MTGLKVSVIIPIYNNAEYLPDAIQSILDQTYPNFEIVLVNDASPDNADEVIKRFQDPRIKYIVHEKNRGLSAARNTGIRASAGDLIAPLDGDDYFHPEKFRLHVEFFDKHPDVGTTYNPRFELNHSAKTIRDLWRPPLTVDLSDLIFGFPFSPSDMVVRRDWMFHVNMFNEYHVYVGEDLDINCRLALAGCKFASVDRALNYRRYHSGRIIKNLRGSVEDTLRPLNSLFADAKCPGQVLALKDKAIANHYLLWSALAFAQDDTLLGQAYCSSAIQKNPAILDGKPNQLIKTLIAHGIVDEGLDHAPILRRMFEQLPETLASQKEQCDWAIARGTLMKATRATIWGRNEDGRRYFEQAAKQHAQVDESFLGQLTQQLINYEIEFGSKAVQKILDTMEPDLAQIGGRARVRQLNASYSINRAFRNYNNGDYSGVPCSIVRAIVSDPKYLTNRGVLAIFIRSLKNSFQIGTTSS